MRFNAAYFALAIALTGINADMVAMDGDLCDGAQGENIDCTGDCGTFSGRHSFAVGTNLFINIH